MAALLLALLSIVALTMRGALAKPAAGLLAGMAAAFMPFALLALPASLYWFRKKGDRRGMRTYVLGALLPVLLIVLATAARRARHGSN
jgi:cytochrome bd-type quinol oxidase subunit 2